jgi:hypothetical protein
MNHQRARDLILRAVAEGRPLPGGAVAHAGACQTCGPWLDRVLAAERAWEGQEGLSAREMADLEGRVVAAVPGPARSAAAWWWLLAPALAAGLALVVVGSPGESAWRHRGESTAPAGAASRVRVLCVGEDGLRAEGRTDLPGVEPLRCRVADLLAISVTSDGSAAARHVFVVGRTGEGATRWYRPRPEEGTSVRLPDHAVTDQALAGVRLAVNHAPGRLVLHVLFSAEPLTVEQVTQGLEDRDGAAGWTAGVTWQRLELVLE